MEVVNQTLLACIAIFFVLFIIVLTNFKHWKQGWRRDRWVIMKEVYLKVLHDKLSDDGTQYTPIGSELWDRISKAVNAGDRQYPLYGGKIFRAYLLQRISSIVEDIKEDNAIAIRRRIDKEYKEYLQRKEEQNDTNQPTD